MGKKLTRSVTNRFLCGVCGGAGDYLGIDPTVVRILWVLFSLMGGAGVILYIVAALIVPQAEY
jgi:phage shock protein C